MTTPSQAKQSSGYGPRIYGWPPTPPHEFENISVTSAIGGGLPKPFLIGWAAKVTAEAAIKHHETVGRLIESGDERAAVDLLKGSRYRDMGTKADRGTIVHAAFENYIAGKKPTKAAIEAQLKEATVPKSMWPSAHKMVSGLMEFLFDEEPEVYWSEATVYSRTHGYAGTADLIARMRVGDSLVPVILDVKTSKRIYGETAYQLCAYARAEFVGGDDGSESTLIPDDSWENPTPIEHGIVVRPTPSGTYEKAVFNLTDAIFERFLAMVTVAKLHGIEDSVRRP